MLDRALSELAWLFPARWGPPRSGLCDPEEWPLFQAPYSALAAFCLEQRATDTAWGRMRGLWRFLLPGPHETAPLRAERAHWRYLLDRFAHRSPARQGRTGHADVLGCAREPGEEQGSNDD